MENDKMVKASDVKEYFKRVIFGADQKIDAWVDSIPAADVRPVVRGEWVEDCTEYVCSVCGQRVSDEIPYMISPPGMPSWCPNPNCGAMMKGAE